MACVGILSGFATAATTGDTQRSLQVAVAMFAVTGALLTVRLWRIMRAAGLPPADPARKLPVPSRPNILDLCAATWDKASPLT
jgi:hypothetical protein